MPWKSLHIEEHRQLMETITGVMESKTSWSCDQTPNKKRKQLKLLIFASQLHVKSLYLGYVMQKVLPMSFRFFSSLSSSCSRQRRSWWRPAASSDAPPAAVTPIAIVVARWREVDQLTVGIINSSSSNYRRAQWHIVAVNCLRLDSALTACYCWSTRRPCNDREIFHVLIELICNVGKDQPVEQLGIANG